MQTTEMQITDVRIRTINNSEGRLRATASVTFNGQFVVHEVRVIEGQNGLFVSMPARKANDRYRDIAHPLNQELRQAISDAVLAAYNGAQ